MYFNGLGFKIKNQKKFLVFNKAYQLSHFKSELNLEIETCTKKDTNFLFF